MRQIRKAIAVAALALSGLALGCVAEIGEPFEEEGGFLEVRWAIEGGRDAVLCPLSGADTFVLELFDPLGFFVEDVEAPCELFAAGIEIEEGFYDARAALLAGRDILITEPIFIFDIRVDAGFITDVFINFEEEDFFFFTDELPRRIDDPFFDDDIFR